jgi:thymidylate kinase
MRVPVKIIVLDGCGGLGKTTLAKAVSNQCIAEDARVLSVAFPSNDGRETLERNDLADSQKAFAMITEQVHDLQALINKTIENVNNEMACYDDNYIIVDRCFMSTAVYQTMDREDDEDMETLIKMFHMLFHDMIQNLNSLHGNVFITMHYFILTGTTQDIVQSKYERARASLNLDKIDSDAWEAQMRSFYNKTINTQEAFEAAFEIALKCQEAKPANLVFYRTLDRDLFAFGSRSSQLSPLRTVDELIRRDAALVQFLTLKDYLEARSKFDNTKMQMKGG